MSIGSSPLEWTMPSFVFCCCFTHIAIDSIFAEAVLLHHTTSLHHHNTKYYITTSPHHWNTTQTHHIATSSLYPMATTSLYSYIKPSLHPHNNALSPERSMYMSSHSVYHFLVRSFSGILITVGKWVFTFLSAVIETHVYKLWKLYRVHSSQNFGRSQHWLQDISLLY